MKLWYIGSRNFFTSIEPDLKSPKGEAFFLEQAKLLCYFIFDRIPSGTVNALLDILTKGLDPDDFDTTRKLRDELYRRMNEANHEIWNLPNHP